MADSPKLRPTISLALNLEVGVVASLDASQVSPGLTQDPTLATAFATAFVT